MSAEGMTEEKRYTLAEAKLELHRQECEGSGHDYKVLVHFGRNAPDAIICQRCGLSWTCLDGAET